MGARGISLAVLCGELTAAWLNDEPLPLPAALAKHLAAERFVSA
jgi:tRNA 5-methylaminomethyl-2-thiouridine biosynthesis bifunctional protein